MKVYKVIGCRNLRPDFFVVARGMGEAWAAALALQRCDKGHSASFGEGATEFGVRIKMVMEISPEVPCDSPLTEGA